MASRSKNMLFKAREDKERRIRLQLEQLEIALNEAESDDEREVAQANLNEYYAERDAEREKKNQLKEAKAAGREARRKAQVHAGGRRRIQWTEGGREMVPGPSKRGKEFFAAASGNLVKCSREITRWETDNPYENVRGIKKGEILMVISDHRIGDNNKSVVDVMVGPDIVKGVPAAALRPLDA